MWKLFTFEDFKEFALHHKIDRMKIIEKNPARIIVRLPMPVPTYVLSKIDAGRMFGLLIEIAPLRWWECLIEKFQFKQMKR